MFDSINVHRVQYITIGEIKESVNCEGQPYCYRKIIIGDENGDLTINVFGDEGNAVNLLVNATVAVEEPTGDGYAESMDGSAS